MNALDRNIQALMQEASRKAILPRYQKLRNDQIQEKAKPGEIEDVVTIADTEAELILAEALARLEPSLAIVGEEAAHADPTVLDKLTGSCWVVDPLDGTNNFAAGKPPFGILISRTEGGVPQSGWIYDCLSERFCAAHRGKGAYKNGERIVAQASGKIPPIAAISIVFMDLDRRERVRRHIAPHYTLVDTPRCAAEQYPRLALGQNDVSIFERTLPWDHSAGALWLNEAGGKVARPDGSPYRVDEHERTGMIAAASVPLWEEIANHYRNII